jgi:hypothetical protein
MSQGRLFGITVQQNDSCQENPGMVGFRERLQVMLDGRGRSLSPPGAGGLGRKAEGRKQTLAATHVGFGCEAMPFLPVHYT